MTILFEGLIIRLISNAIDPPSNVMIFTEPALAASGDSIVLHGINCQEIQRKQIYLNAGCRSMKRNGRNHGYKYKISAYSMLILCYIYELVLENGVRMCIFASEMNESTKKKTNK